MELRYLYVGSTDTDADAALWCHLPGAQLRWRFRHFGADVAAVDLGARPVILVADHRSAGSILPIYAVEDLDREASKLEEGGWQVQLGPVGTPEGPASVLRSVGGAEIALLQVDRPEAMERAYADENNTHAVRLSES